MIQKINLEQMQRDIDSRQLTVSEPEPKRTEKQERVIEEIWVTLTEIYGSSLVSQYGESMPDKWVILLKGLTIEQIKHGLNSLATRGSGFPPNGVEFRQLCMGEKFDKQGNDISKHHKSAAYLDWHDPKHPRNDPKSRGYIKPQSRALEYRDKRKAAGRAALASMMDMLPDKIIDEEE